MNIILRNLGNISGDDASKIKFILLDDGTLLYGRVEWHKDLVSAAELGQDIRVVGAGVVPRDVHDTRDESWGNWKSTGYNVVTPVELQKEIMNVFVSAQNKEDK